MNRGKRILFVSHCILNANAKVEGLASYPGAVNDLMKFLMEKELGIVQLPCPELQILGIRRWGHVKDQLSHPHFKQACGTLLSPFVQQAQMFLAQEYDIIGVVGVDGSPSCGVTKTCRSKEWAGDFLAPEQTWKKVNDLSWVEEPGIFMQIFQSMLTEKRICLDFFSLDESDPKTSLPKLTAALSQAIDRA